jgi:hypothetical protein
LVARSIRDKKVVGVFIAFSCAASAQQNELMILFSPLVHSGSGTHPSAWTSTPREVKV